MNLLVILSISLRDSRTPLQSASASYRDIGMPPHFKLSRSVSTSSLPHSELYFDFGGEAAITWPGAGVVNCLRALSSPSLLPLLSIEVTL
jgi:hypothetical protein